MKKLLLMGLAAALLCQQVFAAWAARLVISPASLKRDPKDAADSRFTAEAARLARGVSVSATEKGRVTISLAAVADQGEMGKGYYLVVSKKRLATDALELRSVLGSHDIALDGSRVVTRRSTPAGFEEVRPLQPIKRNGEYVIELVLDRGKALRSYVVWDHKVIYEKGALVMDGGLWLTYDLPAFVEAGSK